VYLCPVINMKIKSTCTWIHNAVCGFDNFAKSRWIIVENPMFTYIYRDFVRFQEYAGALSDNVHGSWIRARLLVVETSTAISPPWYTITYDEVTRPVQYVCINGPTVRSFRDHITRYTIVLRIEINNWYELLYNNMYQLVLVIVCEHR
jgi:hypothetical protein